MVDAEKNPSCVSFQTENSGFASRSGFSVASQRFQTYVKSKKKYILKRKETGSLQKLFSQFGASNQRAISRG